MKKIVYSISIICCLIFTVSCSEDVNESFENTEAELLEEEMSVKSLRDIEDLVFLNQFSQTEEQLGGILSDNFSEIMGNYNLDDLSINKDHIIISRTDEGVRSYNITLMIPEKNGRTELDMRTYMTLNFKDDINIHNRLQTGFLADSFLDFDSEGDIITSGKYYPGYPYGSGSSPANKPSKAPKSVICAHASSLIGLNGYCGFTPGYCNNDNGQCPPPESMLGYINVWLADLTADDLVIPVRNGMDPNRNTYEMDYDVFKTDPFGIDSQLKNEMMAYYYLNEPRTGGIYSYTGPNSFYNFNIANQTEAWHIHKEAFIRSFQNWWYTLEDNVPNTFFLMMANQNIMRNVFMMFANLNLDSDMEEGIYLLQNGLIVFYSNNPTLTCLTARADYFYTTEAYTYLQQVDAGTMTWQQFEALLPTCN